jgi:anti-anti-sigma regulatory factor
VEVVSGCLPRVPTLEGIVANQQSHHHAELTVDSIGGVLAIAVRGELVRGATQPLRDCLLQAVRSARPVVLDLTETSALDGAGVRVLMDAHGRLATRLRVVCPRGGQVYGVLRQQGVAHVLLLHGSRAEALTAAAPR